MTSNSLSGIWKFLNHAQNLDPNTNPQGQNGYAREFQEIKQLSSKLKKDRNFSTHAGELEFNRSKNRYKDILPFDQSRIILPTLPGVEGSDYINGNYIKGPHGEVSYLATQGPLPRTVDDFWRMIWHHKVQVVVMVCREYEMGKMKCKKYWPGSVGACIQAADMIVKMESEETVGEGFTTRVLLVACGQEKRHITQFHYTAWPDHDVPNSAAPLLELNRSLRTYTKDSGQPVVVHCSAGCGRTGTICAVDYAWSLLKMQKTENFSVFKIVADMRRQRPAMVQTKEQYAFIYKAVIQLAKEELENTTFKDHTYVNVELKRNASEDADDYANCEFVESVQRWNQDGQTPKTMPAPSTVKLQEKNPPAFDQNKGKPTPRLASEMPSFVSGGNPAQQANLMPSIGLDHAYVNVDFSATEDKAVADTDKQSGDYVNVDGNAGAQEPKVPSKENRLPISKRPNVAKPRPTGLVIDKYQDPTRVLTQGVKAKSSGSPVSEFAAPRTPTGARPRLSGFSGSDYVVPPQGRSKDAKSGSNGFSGSDYVVPPQVQPQEAKPRPTPPVHTKDAKPRPSGFSGSDYVVPPHVHSQSVAARPSNMIDGEYVIPAQAQHPSNKNGASNAAEMGPVKGAERNISQAVPEGLLIDFSEPSKAALTKRHSSGYINVPVAGAGGHRKISSPAIIDGQKFFSKSSLPSNAEDYVIPASVISSNSRQGLNPGPAVSKKPNAFKASAVDPAKGQDNSGAAEDDGYSLVSVSHRDPTPRDNGYSLVSVPHRNPPASDDGYSFVSMPQPDLAARNSQSPPRSDVTPGRPPVLSKPLGIKSSEVAEGQYSMVGPSGDASKHLARNQRDEVAPNQFHNSTSSYCLVGIPESKAKSTVNDSAPAPANSDTSDSNGVVEPSAAPVRLPYSLVGRPSLERNKLDDLLEEDPTYSTVPKFGKDAVSAQAPPPPSIKSMPKKSKSVGDIKRDIERDKKRLSPGDVTLQQDEANDTYAAVIPKSSRGKDANTGTGFDSPSGSIGPQSPREQHSGTSSGSLKSFNSSSDDPEEPLPPVPVKTSSAFVLPGERDDVYDNVEKSHSLKGGTLGRLKKNMTKMIVMKRASDQSLDETFQSGNNWLRDLEYLKRVSKPVGSKALPTQWPSFSCFARV